MILCVAHNGFSASEGTTSGDILKFGVGARAIAMGEAYVALSDDVNSLYWNPAGLALMPRSQASFTYSQLPQELQFNNASVAVPFDNGAVGGSLSYLSYGQITGYDSAGNPAGDVKAYSGVGTLGAALLGNLWTAGINVKGIQETLSSEKANGVAFDAGAMISYPKRIGEGSLRFGGVVQNVGQGLQFIQQRDPLPTQWKLGVAAVDLLDKRLNMDLDFTQPRETASTVQTGAEFWVEKHLAIRVGYTSSHTQGFGIRTGLGLRLRDFSFDYAYAGEGELGIVHRYEVSMRFGAPRLRLRIEDQVILREAKAAMRNKQYDLAAILYDRLLRMEPRYTKGYPLMQKAIAKLQKSHPEASTVVNGPPGVPMFKGPERPDIVAAPEGLPENDAEDIANLLNADNPKPTADANALAPLVGSDSAQPESKKP